MEPDTATRYRSRILREMNANRENPFNSPPSSTGSHGTMSPTVSSVFSDPDGESTRRLNEDIARVTAPRKLPVNWDVAHRKWPEFFSKPRDQPIFDDNTDTRPLSSQSKENKAPGAAAVKFADDQAQNARSSKRSRAEMQPYVDNESDLSSILAKSPGRGLSKSAYNPSPMGKSHKPQTQSPSAAQPQRLSSISDALDQLRRTSLSPRNRDRRGPSGEDSSPHMSSAKSSLTAVPPSPASMSSPGHNASNVRSFFMPDVSHLGDFVTGTLRFSGSNKNGVPIFVKHGRVHDRRARPPSAVSHAVVDGIEVPEDEEKIFVSMDMIRDEIISLQEHHDKVQEYAESLQQQVEKMEGQLKSQKNLTGGSTFGRGDEQVVARKNQLEIEVATLQSRLDQAARKASTAEIENESLAQERDRAINRLQDACDDINKLTRKLSYKEKELETSQRSSSSIQSQQENDTLRRDLVSLKHGRNALELENSALQSENENLQRDNTTLREESESLRSDVDVLRRDNQSLLSENRSLRSNNKSLMEENEDLRENLDGLQHEVDAVRKELEMIKQEKSTLREDNDSLVRHNEKYFSENKILRRENSGFESSVHDLHKENIKLKEQVEFLTQQLDHCRPIPKDDFSARLDDHTEENMTSAFFLPDITMNTNITGAVENTQTRDMPAPPELTIGELTEQHTRDMTRPKSQQRSRSKSRGPTSRNGTQHQKVAFSIPDDTLQSNKSVTNVANKGSKRSATRRSSLPSAGLLDDNDDTTGVLSVDNITEDQSFQLDLTSLSRKEKKQDAEGQARVQNVANQAQRSSHTRTASGSSQRRKSDPSPLAAIKSVDKDSCPALSDKARRVLDSLCEHSCQNCIVCSRITSHRGVISSSDVAAGKKRVTVDRPIPVSDRDLSVEDPTMRPSQSPGHALALVIKGLEDESRHLQLELSRLQGEYNGSDKAHGRRERTAMAEGIRTLLKRLEVKNDQIYSLYDVLEGQKAAGQAMSEEEVEMTVLSITGMTVRDVTSGSDQLTWDGIQDA